LPEELNAKVEQIIQYEYDTQIKVIYSLLCTINEKDKVVAWDTLPRLHLESKVAVWRGDITLLKIDAIVNAANKFMLGCFTPNHPCIDNQIHCKAGKMMLLVTSNF
jgi:hypothetical protein